VGRRHREGREEDLSFEIQLATLCWMQNVNSLCVGAGLIGNGCACPHLAARKAVATRGSPCPGSAAAAWLDVALGAEAAPQASSLLKHFCLCFSSFRSLQAASLLFFSGGGLVLPAARFRPGC